MTAVTAVTARAPAKVNLQLAVGPLRAHGYHDVVTVYHAVSLFDEVTVAPADTDSVVVTGEGADSVPADGTNLAARAAEALAQAVGPGCKDSPGLTIRISKRIPVAAGLAGGSADAAAALVACNELWRTGLSQAELCELAAGIGSEIAAGWRSLVSSGATSPAFPDRNAAMSLLSSSGGSAAPAFPAPRVVRMRSHAAYTCAVDSPPLANASTQW